MLACNFFIARFDYSNFWAAQSYHNKPIHNDCPCYVMAISDSDLRKEFDCIFSLQADMQYDIFCIQLK